MATESERDLPLSNNPPFTKDELLLFPGGPASDDVYEDQMGRVATILLAPVWVLVVVVMEVGAFAQRLLAWRTRRRAA